MGFSRHEYWSGLPFPSPGIFPTQGWNPGLLHCRQMLYHLSYQGSPWVKSCGINMPTDYFNHPVSSWKQILCPENRIFKVQETSIHYTEEYPIKVPPAELEIYQVSP